MTTLPFNLGNRLFFMHEGRLKEGILKKICTTLGDSYKITTLYTICCGGVHFSVEPEQLFENAEECEKTFVLKNFGHSFKDTKTLK